MYKDICCVIHIYILDNVTFKFKENLLHQHQDPATQLNKPSKMCPVLFRIVYCRYAVYPLPECAAESGSNMASLLQRILFMIR